MKIGLSFDELIAAGERFQDRASHRKSERSKKVASTEIIERLETRLSLRGYSKVESEALVTLGKSGGQQAAATLERIINENDLTAIQFFIRGLAMARAVCRIVIRDSANRTLGYGTGFRIGPSLIMTNNHVLENPDIARNSIAQFDFFGLTGPGQVPITECALNPAAFYRTDKVLDFSIVALNTGDEAAAGRAWFRLIRASGKALKGEAVNILQHPGGEPMQIAFRNNQIVDVLENFLHYGADTLPGSSGSPVTNDAWDLAALHHSGVPAMDRGAILKLDNTPFKRGDDPSLIRWVAN